MRLATARVDGTHRLWLETESGMLDVAAARTDLAPLQDVGALLRAGDAALSAVGELKAGDGPTVAVTDLDLAAPVVAPSKIICIGLNYRKHAAESGLQIPPHPVMFAKFANALAGSGDPVVCPPITERLDYEGELGVIIGRRAQRVTRDEAAAYVAGYVAANDISARDLQLGDPGSQWLRGKTLDGFAPMGPFFVTRDDVDDWRAIRIATRVNGELRQDESCGDMVFGVEELVAFISEGITLEPGDIILTGTPSGVGLGFDPPRWLKPGDVVEIELTGLGTLVSPIATP